MVVKREITSPNIKQLTLIKMNLTPFIILASISLFLAPCTGQRGALLAAVIARMNQYRYNYYPYYYYYNYPRTPVTAKDPDSDENQDKSNDDEKSKNTSSSNESKDNSLSEEDDRSEETDNDEPSREVKGKRKRPSLGKGKDRKRKGKKCKPFSSRKSKDSAEDDDTSSEEGRDSSSTEGQSSSPTEGQSSTPAEGQSSSPDEGQSSSPDESQSSSPTEGQGSSPAEGQSSKPTESRKPKGRKRKPSSSGKRKGSKNDDGGSSKEDGGASPTQDGGSSSASDTVAPRSLCLPEPTTRALHSQPVTPTKDNCRFGEVASITTLGGEMVACNAVLTRAKVGDATKVTLVTSYLCVQSIDNLANDPNSGLELALGSKKFSLRGPFQTKAGVNGAAFLDFPVGSPVLSGLSSCETPSCAFNPQTMQGKLNMADCKMISHGATDENDFTFEGKREVALQQKPFGCSGLEDLFEASNTLCMESTSGLPVFCVGDNGAPIYCKSPSTDEWILIGITAAQTTCGISSEIQVIQVPI